MGRPSSGSPRHPCGPAVDHHPLWLLSGDELAGRHGAGRHRALRRAGRGSGSVSGLHETDARFYLVQAAHWARAYLAIGPRRYDTLNLYDTAGLAHFELDEAIRQAGDPTGLAVTEAQLLTNLNKLIRIGATQAAKTPFGYGAAWNSADSVSAVTVCR